MEKIATIAISKYIYIPYRLDYEVEIKIPKGEDIEKYIRNMSEYELKNHLMESCVKLEEIDQNSQREDRYLGEAVIIDIKEDDEKNIKYVENDSIQYQELQEIYLFKLQELYEILKGSNYNENDILNKIETIKSWGKKNQFEIQRLNDKKILGIYRELKEFYKQLWLISDIKTVEMHYSTLSNPVKELYDIDDIFRDWEARMYSKKNYEEMLGFLEKGYFFKDELQDKLNTYQEKQIYYTENYDKYFFDWNVIDQKYNRYILDKDLKKINGIEFNMISGPIGQIVMCNDDPTRRRLINISRKFWIGETPVTMELWCEIMKWKYPKSNNFINNSTVPMANVTWYDCLEFCNKLSQIEGFQPCYLLSEIDKDGNNIDYAKVEWNRQANGYRLPTEVEWQYCATAGSEFIYSGSNNIDEVAWYADNSIIKSSQTVREVKKKKPNAWGLYDMSGNIWEWCHDIWHSKNYFNQTNADDPMNIYWTGIKDGRATRGGSCRYEPERCQISYTLRSPANNTSGLRGMRLFRYQS